MVLVHNHLKLYLPSCSHSQYRESSVSSLANGMFFISSASRGAKIPSILATFQVLVSSLIKQSTVASSIVSVKLLFTTICFVGFYSVPNLIVIIFNLLYLVCIVGFHCKGYVIERVVWRLKHLKTEEDFVGISQLSIPQSISCALHVLEFEESG